MPPVGRIFEEFSPETADFSIIRLHGGDRKQIEADAGEVWNRLIAPKPEAVQAAAKIVRANARRRVLTYVNVNNHLEGSAPLTIQRLLDVLADEKTS